MNNGALNIHMSLSGHDSIFLAYIFRNGMTVPSQVFNLSRSCQFSFVSWWPVPLPPCLHLPIFMAVANLVGVE